MGAMLPKPVETTVVERKTFRGFRVGVAELNGWRNDMEDAHLIHAKDTWGFFGVFDGHGGQECSKYVARKIEDELNKDGCPADDAAVKKLILGVDQAFLDTEQSSGSTATMCIIHKPTDGDKHKLRVINAGDSRVLLGRRDGTIVDGGGTDSGLTVDHKPGHPDERARIERCGGTVEVAAGGVMRVNGDLAVSRGFGDATYKKTGGPGPEDRPVTANPELGLFECDAADFVLLVCDGVSEGDFPNPEVVKLVADCLKANGDDIGAAAAKVCHKAVETGSKDNVTCMIVLVQGADKEESSVEFNPGPLVGPNDSGVVGFMKAYTAMADKAGYTLAEAVEKRYQHLEKELQRSGLPADREKDLKEELSKITVNGKPPGNEGSDEYKEFFNNWAKNLPGPDEGGGSNYDQLSLLRQLMSSQQQNEGDNNGRKVRIPDGEALMISVNDHPKLAWDEKMTKLPGQEGIVLQDDSSDNTSRVKFPAPISMIAWLPSDLLIDLGS